MTARTETHIATPGEAGWQTCAVTLPQPVNWVVLDLTAEEPETWALGEAEEHFAPDASAERHREFADELLWYWIAANRQRALCAAVLSPPGAPVLASYTVRELDLTATELRLDVLRAQAEEASGPYCRPQEITETTTPLGPAVRVHRLEPTAPDMASGNVVEGVAHYVLPAEHPGTALEARMVWGAIGLGEELAEIADELAGSVRLD